MKRSIKTRKLRDGAHTICAAGAFLLATAVIAQARMDCTKVTRDHWMGRVAISQIAHASGYPVIKAISLEGSCYKVTALTALGREADAYFDPVTGDVTAAWISVD